MNAVLQQKGSLASLLPVALAKTREKDRPLLQELCYGTLRHFYSLNEQISQHLSKPLREKDNDVRALLLVGGYQLIHTRIPAYAAINSTVSAAQYFKKTWAKALINAVLRKIQRNLENGNKEIADDVSRYDHPQWLMDAIRSSWPAQAEALLLANNTRAPMTLRVNRHQSSRDSYLQLLKDHVIAAQPTLLSDVGIRLEIPVSVELLPGFASGSVSVQDEAAQLSSELLRLQAHHQVLDACAAPGGKTGHLLEHESTLSVLALDVDAERTALIRENLRRLQLKAQVVTADAAQPDQWWQNYADKKLFDRILLDAPCSATGVIRHHPDIKILRRPSDIPALAATQLKLLQALWPLLNPGGYLLYVTCSILPQENDEVITQFLTTTPDAMIDTLEVSWGDVTRYGRQLFPQTGGHDGFYFSRLVKNLQS